MTVKIRIPRLFSSGPSRGATALAGGSQPVGATFHAALTDCEDDWAVQQTQRAATFTSRPVPRQAERSAGGPLGRAWAWMHSKVVATATKRLRVSETVSLGEKRFVALVSVEGREFLVGGGPTGVSLLAQLGTDSGVRKGATGYSE
jgi:hypothetical protein